MRILVIGAVAAGTSAATKARRNNEQAEIVIYEKDQDISYAGCGLPYYIGGEINDITQITPRDAAMFKRKYNIDVKIRHEVLEILPEEKALKVQNMMTGEVFSDTYDKLVIATGAKSFIPNIEGKDAEHVFSLRNVQDARNIRSFIEGKKPKTAVIAGTGAIGFEVLENFVNRGIDVTVVELAKKITPNLDEDMAAFLENLICQKGIRILNETSIQKIEKSHVLLSDGSKLDADLVLLATGIKPNTDLAKSIGIELGLKGAIKVNPAMQTNLPDIYACGDCIETFSSIDGRPVYTPLGSTANKTGRIAGDALTGGTLRYRGNVGSGIFKLFEYTIASTGLSEREALELGYDIQVAHLIRPNKTEYFHGEDMAIKVVADKKSMRLLGAQIIGTIGVDKRIDVFATLITYEAKIDDVFYLDLSYAPPFSTAKDPVHYAGMVLENAVNKGRKLLRAEELDKQDDSLQVIDARSPEDHAEKGCIDCAVNVPHENLRKKLDSFDSEKKTVIYCNKGGTGNAAQNILLGRGFKEVYNLSGGYTFYDKSKKKTDDQ